MRSSSLAYILGTAVVFVTMLSYSPVLLTPDALAQTTTIYLAPSTLQIAPAKTIVPITIPAVTQTKVVPIIAAPEVATSSTTTTYPRLVVPSIDVNDPIVPEGVNSSGQMAVPNGKTDQVGWWDGGPKPGDVGSAVLDAHVFAAFSKLDKLQTGDSIYVEENATTTLHFVVTKTELFPLSQITSQDLFVPTQDRDLNLITCAGQLTPDHSTYDHRFVVYSTLEN